jgi:hypothetical protein
MIILQDANWLQMGRILWCIDACADTCYLVATEMREALVMYIVENDWLWHAAGIHDRKYV